MNKTNNNDNVKPINLIKQYKILNNYRITVPHTAIEYSLK